jgi:hypothetical protein
MIVLPDAQARVFYTVTDTAALQHIKGHIDDLYEEAIRHGVAILDSRKGVEAAEALRIRQATQSSSIYSIYLSALNAIRKSVVLMCKWAGYNEEDVIIDAPSSLTFGIPDATIMRELVEGFTIGVFPLPIVHKYLVSSGLLDQTISYEEYVELIKENEKLKKQLKLSNTLDGKSESKNEDGKEGDDVNARGVPKNVDVSKEVIEDVEGQQNK